MSMSDWAKREIKIACKGSEGDKSFDGYYKSCCESALKAFESLTKDGHSGMSIQVTKEILNRLIDGKPLTPIREEDGDIWEHTWYNKDKKCKEYQCKRMSSLFKSVYDDGTVEYSDVDRAYGFSPENPNATFSSGRVTKAVNDRYPITLPYYPSTKRYGVAIEDFLVDPDNGDFDTIGVLYIIKPDGEKEEVGEYYHETKDGFKPISKQVYDEFKRMAEARVKGE